MNHLTSLLQVVSLSDEASTDGDVEIVPVTGHTPVQAVGQASSEAQHQAEIAPLDYINERVTFKQSLLVFKDLFFWSLLWGYLWGIAGAILILTGAQQEWRGECRSCCCQ